MIPMLFHQLTGTLMLTWDAIGSLVVLDWILLERKLISVKELLQLWT